MARPALPRGVLLSSYPIRPLEPLEDTGATILWEEHEMIDAALVDTIHGARYRVFAWTVNDEWEMRRLIALNVDGLCGNYPDVARRAVDKGVRTA
jgi:glycerophosphoryl diester phosphodiesterase